MGMFRTGGPGARGVSAFLFEPNLPGVTIERVTEKLGIHTSNTCDLAFDDVEVGPEALLGEEGAGFGNAMTALTAGRIGIAAQAIGILAACLDESVKFAKERIAFGKPIGAFEGVSFKIAQMAMDLDAARMLTYRAAALADAGEPFAIPASKAKLFASTAARRHAAEALQIHGGYGYTTEFAVERHYRCLLYTSLRGSRRRRRRRTSRRAGDCGDSVHRPVAARFRAVRPHDGRVRRHVRDPGQLRDNARGAR